MKTRAKERREPRTRLAIAAGALACCASPLAAQTYSIPRHVVASGGGTSTGAAFAVTGVISEVGAGGSLTGGPYSLTGGFWSMPLVPAEPFTDEPLVAGASLVRALHVTELRARVNALRARFGLGNAAWTDSVPGGATIKAQHVTEMRVALQAAYAQAGVSFPALDDAVLTPGITQVRAVHLLQLRLLVKNLEEQ
jgi:opacity protein-like surface antigen